jgi:hypothetical protein
MKQIILHAKSGNEEPCQVTFTEDDGKVKILCDCPEGMQGLVCEHKIRLASNDHLMLPSPAQMKDLNEAHMWVIQSPMSDLILRLYDMGTEGEQNEEQVQALLNEIGTAMKEGM